MLQDYLWLNPFCCAKKNFAIFVVTLQCDCVMVGLFHGSQKIIRRPIFGAGNPKNDYGLGLYCTADIDLAIEWACSEEDDGFANRYRIEADGLSHLHLNEDGYNILNWLAILLENRTFDLSLLSAVRAKKYILDNFLPDYQKYDIITGYRADDSYFSFSRAFLSNGITIGQLKRAMSLGKPGEQTVLRSHAAFERLTFVEAIPADASVYHPRRMQRDRNARSAFQQMLQEDPGQDAVYVSDIIKEGWKADDPRL